MYVPTEKFDTYLADAGVKHSEELSEQQIKHLFLTAIEDFYNIDLGVDELSIIAGAFAYNAHNNQELSDSTLASAINAASELSYYVREIAEDSPHTANIFAELLITVRNYYEQYSKQ